MSGSTIRITVLVPGLAGPPAEAAGDAREAAALLLCGLELPGLADLLGRGRSLAGALPEQSLAQMGCHLLGVPVAESGELPAAALSRHALMDDAGDAVWVRADPVHLRADMARLIVLASPALGLSFDHASRIAGWLNEQAGGAAPVVEPVSGRCWTARLDAAPRMATTAPEDAHGRDATGCLPRGEDAPVWHRRMNELQMMLHACPVNEERERDGLLPVNSLWFWGAGPLPPAPPRPPLDGVCADDEVLRGAARWSGAAAGTLPADCARWCAGLAPGHHLLGLDALTFPVRALDVDAWRGALSELDRDWLAPLARALREGRLQQVDLHAGGGAGVTASRPGPWRWWRRRVDLPRAAAALRAGTPG